MKPGNFIPLGRGASRALANRPLKIEPSRRVAASPIHHFGGCVISKAQIAAGRMYIDAL
jgi:hypothetical protein